MSIKRLSRAGTSGLLLSVCLSGTLNAQSDDPSQPNWDFFFSSEARFDDNATLSDVSPGNSSFLINTFGVGNRTSTRVSDFLLDLSAHVRVQDTPTQSETVVLDDPRINLAYDREVGDDSLSFSFQARKVDLAFVDALEEGGNLNDLDFDDARGDGSRESLEASLGGVINAESPLTFEYLFNTSQRRYVDETDADDLDDLSQFFGFGSVLFDVTRTMRGAVDVEYDFRDEDDDSQTIRRRASATVGFNAALDSRTLLRARIGYSEVRTERQTFDTEETTTGTVGSLAWIRELKDGEVNFVYAVDLDENGQEDRLLIGRTVDRQDTQFGGDIGISARGFSNDIRPIGSIFFNQDLPRARFGASLEQDFAVSEDSEDSIFTRLNLNYEQDFTSDLSLILNLAAGRRFDTANENQERRRLNATATLRNALNRNWDLDVGYRFRYREGDDSSIGTSNAVFAALVRDLQID